MCRSNIATIAQSALAQVLADIREALAAEAGVDPETVLVGPVDFGDEEPA